MADLTRFAWAVLESIVRKYDTLAIPIETKKVNPAVAAELLAIKAVEERPYTGPYRGRVRPPALFPTATGKKLLAERRHGVED